MARKAAAKPKESPVSPPSVQVTEVPETILPGQPWTMIRLPAETVSTFGTKARVSVRILIGSQEFATSIMPSGDGTHHLMFNKAMQAAAAGIGWSAGQPITFEVRKDNLPRPETPMPKELENALEADPTARALFEKLAPSHKKEHIRYVSEAKQEATRQRRAVRCLEIIHSGKKPDF